jgi:hypothetical protein
MTDTNGLRMYFFVMYNLSGIQKGIQAGHAAVEYQLKYGKTKKYKDFVKNHKTFILLDGGGSNDMLVREQELEDLGIKFASFIEPDLNNSVSAIAFIVPEHIYNCVDSEIDTWRLEGNRYKTKKLYDYLRSFRLASN